MFLGCSSLGSVLLSSSFLLGSQQRAHADGPVLADLVVRRSGRAAARSTGLVPHVFQPRVQQSLNRSNRAFGDQQYVTKWT
jgi:hypothetical protein